MFVMPRPVYEYHNEVSGVMPYFFLSFFGAVLLHSHYAALLVHDEICDTTSNDGLRHETTCSFDIKSSQLALNTNA